MAASKPKSYAGVVRATTPNPTAKPVFIIESEIFGDVKPKREDWLRDVELYGILGSVIPAETIRGLQRIPNGFVENLCRHKCGQRSSPV